MYKYNKTEQAYIEAIGERITKARKALGMTQEQLADAIPMDRSGLSFIETGRNACNVVTLMKIAAVLGVDAKQLL